MENQKLLQEDWDFDALLKDEYDGHTLTVVFHNSGAYDHPGVPYGVYAAFMQAPSKGRFYSRFIRGRYR